MTMRIPKMTIVAGLLLAAASVLAPLSPAMAQGKVLTMSVGGSTQGNTDLDNLDPRTLLSTDHAAVQIGILGTPGALYSADIVPGMAESWEISPDGMTYTFHLRDAKWSDGKPVTSGDFVCAFERMFQSSPASQIYDDILNGADVRDGTAKPEELGVEGARRQDRGHHAAGPAPYFLGLISSHFAAPGRADLVEKYRRRLRRGGRRALPPTGRSS